MGATFSNPLGHVEDMPIVRLHDKVYKLNGSDWRYHDSSALLKPVWLPNYIQRYLANRAESHPTSVKGVKDPRAVHFLKEWQVANTQQIKYLFIYRHWREACFSLLNRHSRHFLNSTLAMSEAKLNMSFWQQPSLAFDMWLSANKRMLKFYQAHSQHAVLISQEAFVEHAGSGDASRFAELANKIGLQSSHFEARTLKPDLITKTLPDYACNGISPELIEELDLVYAELNSIADMPNEVSAGVFTNTNTDISNKQSSLPTYISTPGSLRAPALSNIFEEAEFNFSELTWVEFTGALVRLPIARVAPKPFYAALVCDVDFTQSSDITTHVSRQIAEGYYSLAKVAHYKEVWLVTYLFQMRAMLCDAFVNNNADFASLWHMPCWQMFCKNQEGWLQSEDACLLADHPFKLQQPQRLPSYLKEQVPNYESIAALPSHALFSEAAPNLNALEMHVWLICNAPQLNDSNAASDRNQSELANYRITTYIQIAQHYPDNIEIPEFCLIKALRSAFAHPNAQEGAVHINHCLSLLFAFYAQQSIFGFAEAIAIKFGRAGKQIEMPAAKHIIQTLTQAISQHHFQWAEKCINALSPCLSAEHISELQAKLKAERDSLRPAAGLKHRFALLPHSLSFENIQIAGTESPARGRQLDLLNRRLSFLAKDNVQWLNEGLNLVPEQSGACLANLIDSHWQKLWPAEVYRYLFFENTSENALKSSALNNNGSLENSAELDPKGGPSQISSLNCSVLASVSCLSSFVAFLSLYQSQAPSTHLQCILPPSSSVSQQDIEQALSMFNITNASIFTSEVQHEITHLKHSIKHAMQGKYDYLAIVHCKPYKTHLSKLQQVATWYAILGYEFGINDMLTRGDAKLVVPDYHPSVLANIQNKALFYPIMHMAWMHAQSAELVEAIDAPGNEIFWSKLLMANKKAGFDVKMTRQACSGLFV
jgi:hypothetical protein